LSIPQGGTKFQVNVKCHNPGVTAGQIFRVWALSVI
jgi:hypothetical protein